MDYPTLFFSRSQLSSCICDFRRAERRDASRTVFRKFRKNLFAVSGNQIMRGRWDNKARSFSWRNVVGAFAREGRSIREEQGEGAKRAGEVGGEIRREGTMENRGRREAMKIKVLTIGSLRVLEVLPPHSFGGMFHGNCFRRRRVCSLRPAAFCPEFASWLYFARKRSVSHALTSGRRFLLRRDEADEAIRADKRTVKQPE